MYFNNPYAFKNNNNELCKIFVNKDKNLIYSENNIETKIDENIQEFDVNFNISGNIEIIYMTLSGKFKYCNNTNNWSKKILYTIKNSSSEIKELKLVSTQKRLNIFYIFNNKDKLDSSVLVHYSTDGEKSYSNIICPISLTSSAKNHYEIEILYKEKFNIFSLINVKDEFAINACKFNNNTWSKPKKLYRLKGDKISFSSVYLNNKFHILNLSRENSLYTLEHVLINSDESMEKFNIYESKNALQNPILLIQENKVFAMFTENTDILYTYFDNEWASVEKLDTKYDKSIILYRHIWNNNEWENIKSVMGTDSKDTAFILPCKIPEINTPLKIIDDSNYDEVLQNVLKELTNTNERAKKLEKKISFLQKKLNEKKQQLTESNEFLNRVILQKKEIEENYNNLLKKHHNCTNEIEIIKTEMNIYKQKYEDLFEGKKELEQNSILVEKLKLEILEKDKEKDIIQNKLEEELKKKSNDLEKLKFQIAEKENENETIKNQLKNCKNRGFIGKLFGK